MLDNIKNKFNKYQLFGFTGTPILADKKDEGITTTEQIFGKLVHRYSMDQAIKDGCVLPFKIEYYFENDKGANKKTPIV